MFFSILFTVLGLMTAIGVVVFYKKKRQIINGGTLAHGKIISYLVEKSGRQFAVKYVVGFMHNDKYHEVATLTPTPALLKKVGKEVEVYFNEDVPDSIIVKGTYWEELYALFGVFGGVVFIILGVMGLSYYVS